MKTEQQIKEARTEFYRNLVIAKQRGDPFYELLVIYLGFFDWVLDDNKKLCDNNNLLEIFASVDRDKNKLALF